MTDIHLDFKTGIITTIHNKLEWSNHVPINPLSDEELIKTCRLAYQYVLDNCSLEGPTRLTNAQQKELGARLADIWMRTS